MRQARWLLAPLALLALWPGLLAGDGDAAKTSLDAAAKILPELMERFHVPAAVLAVVSAGGEPTVRAFGDAGPDTVFEAASLSKPVFAYAVMRLVAGGRLDLDARLGRDAAGPTPRRLLSHSTAPDGTRRWKYSGAGYVRLQREVERITGEPMTDLVRREVFGPLGMTHSRFTGGRADGEAVGHDREGRPLEARHPAEASAASSLRTTAGDYALFVAHILERARDGDSAAAAMLRPEVTVDADLGMSWGLGWALGSLKAPETPVFFHWGSNPGFKSFAMGSRDTGRGWVLLTNGDNGLEMAGPVAAALESREPRFFRFYMLHPDD